jgi:tRNA A37 threonylcarbamoyltransferase TsaD
VTLEAVRRYQVKLVLLAGGVASNELIRTALLEEGSMSDLKIIFASKELSGDNAVGVGLIGLDLSKIK